MKTKVTVIGILVMILLTACGASTSAAPTATQAIAQAPATSAPVTGAPASSGSGNQVTITLADNTITASTTTFKAGVPYTFVITNTGRHLHNFNINPPVSVTGSLDASLSKALLVVPQEKLRSGASDTETFTFPESAVGQLMEFSCLIRSHYENGMHVDITVTK
jgi:uncharacterized cupredoxin-like copper-binding protein